MSIKVGLYGFGKTGRSVASVLLKSKDTILEWVVRRNPKPGQECVHSVLDIESDEPGLFFSGEQANSKTFLHENPVDIIVDFSSETGIEDYGEMAAEKGIAIVTAISHYSKDKIKALKKLSKKTAVLWSPNITLGINFLIIASKVLSKINPGLDIEILEEHFREKLEMSGTAKKIASALSVPVKKIKSIRAGGIIGKHEVIFGFPSQTVRMIHESINREAFGNGAVFAINNLINKKPGLYSMEDLLMPYFVGKTDV